MMFSETTRMCIVLLFKAGIKQQFILDQVKVSQSTVSNFLKRYRRNVKIKNKRNKCDINLVTTTRDERKLKQIVQNNRLKSVFYYHK